MQTTHWPESKHHVRKIFTQQQSLSQAIDKGMDAKYFPAINFQVHKKTPGQ
jgi:hypothetical protein